MSIQIQIDEGRTAFRPLESIAGTVSWSLPVAPAQLTLELFWTTRGKGKVDSQIVQSMQINQPAASGQQRFELKIPDAPYSFSGKLVSLLWGLRLVPLLGIVYEPSGLGGGGRGAQIPTPPEKQSGPVQPPQEQAQVNLTISPTGHEINLVL